MFRSLLWFYKNERERNMSDIIPGCREQTKFTPKYVRQTARFLMQFGSV